MSAEQHSKVIALLSIPVKDFKGFVSDLFQLNELSNFRIGCDSKWLNDLYNRNFPKA